MLVNILVVLGSFEKKCFILVSSIYFIFAVMDTTLQHPVCPSDIKFIVRPKKCLPDIRPDIRKEVDPVLPQKNRIRGSVLKKRDF